MTVIYLKLLSVSEDKTKVSRLKLGPKRPTLIRFRTLNFHTHLMRLHWHNRFSSQGQTQHTCVMGISSHSSRQFRLKVQAQEEVFGCYYCILSKQARPTTGPLEEWLSWKKQHNYLGRSSYVFFLFQVSVYPIRMIADMSVGGQNASLCTHSSTIHTYAHQYKCQ